VQMESAFVPPAILARIASLLGVHKTAPGTGSARTTHVAAMPTSLDLTAL